MTTNFNNNQAVSFSPSKSPRINEEEVEMQHRDMHTTNNNKNNSSNLNLNDAINIFQQGNMNDSIDDGDDNSMIDNGEKVLKVCDIEGNEGDNLYSSDENGNEFVLNHCDTESVFDKIQFVYPE